jgi:hypothetical protein
MRTKNIISIEAEKAIDEIQYPFMTKICEQISHRRYLYIEIINVIYDKASANIIMNGRKAESFLCRSGSRQGTHFDHFYSTFFWIS